MTKARITIEAPADRPDVLDIRDAMQQVLDVFDLLTGDDDKGRLVWNLVSATTNSPFHAEAEAVSPVPGLDVDTLAATRIAEAADCLAKAAGGDHPGQPPGPRRLKAARRIRERNRAGIGRTVIRFDVASVADIVVTPASAALALDAANAGDGPVADYLPDRRERSEHGSVDGALVQVGTHRNAPAIRIIERRTGREIVCQVGQSVIDEIAGAADFRDVWAQNRVRVRGLIVYDEQGRIVRVMARSVTVVMPRAVSLDDIEDRTFTEDLSITDYIETLREGTLG